MKKQFMSVFFFLASCCAYAAGLKFAVVCDRPDHRYACGETAVYTVTVTDAKGRVPAAGTVDARLDNFGPRQIARATWNLAVTNAFTLSGTLKEPGFLRLTVKSEKTKPCVWSVAFEPEKIRKGSPSPADFDAFWAAARKKLAREVPPDVRLTRMAERSTAAFDFYRLSFATFGRRVYGYLTVPTDKTRAPYPVQFEVNAAGFGGWTNDLKGRPDAICVRFGVYPFDMDWRWKEMGLQARYDELHADARKRYGAANWFTAGITEGREAYSYYPVLLGIDRAVDWVAARPDVDRTRFLYSGTSQGGGFGFYLCGLNKAFTRAVLYVPAITDTMGYLAGRDSGWPQIVECNASTPAKRATAEKWAPYFDGANFASRIACPVCVVVGFSDVTCPPCGVYAAYNEIPAPGKIILHGFGMGHRCRQEFYVRGRSWLENGPDVKADGTRTRVQPVAGDATAAIQNEIDRAFKAGGGTVVVGKGEWRVKALRLRSRVTLYLESGATISGSRKIDDYFILDKDTVEPVPHAWITREAWTLEQSCSRDNFTRYPGSRWNNGLIRLLGAEDAAIIGEKGSVIDGCDPYDPIGEEFYRGPHGVSAINCKRLVLKGYTIRRTGNWAHRIADTVGLHVENVTCEAGHDGVHINGCDDVTIRDCVMKTGDDCVAGFDNRNVLVENCYLNTACSGFRFAGTDVKIRRCTLKGPAEYGFRGSLTKEDKAAGAPSGKARRNNMLSFFTYYSDGTHPVRENAGRIEIVDCTSDDTDRLLHYNYGNEKWQRGKPMTDITFRNVRATRIKMPVSLWGDRAVPVRISFRNCEIGFSAPQKEFIRGAFVSGVELSDVKVTGGIEGPLVRLWHAEARMPAVRTERVEGVGTAVVPAETAWDTRGI